MTLNTYIQCSTSGFITHNYIYCVGIHLNFLLYGDKATTISVPFLFLKFQSGTVMLFTLGVIRQGHLFKHVTVTVAYALILCTL